MGPHQQTSSLSYVANTPPHRPNDRCRDTGIRKDSNVFRPISVSPSPPIYFFSHVKDTSKNRRFNLVKIEMMVFQNNLLHYNLF